MADGRGINCNKKRIQIPMDRIRRFLLANSTLTSSLHIANRFKKDFAEKGMVVLREYGNRLPSLDAVASALNNATGFAAVEQLKSRVLEKDALVAACRTEARLARLRYDDAVDARRRCQTHLTRLLQRKDAWDDGDITQFTELYRGELRLETDEQQAKVHAKNAADALDAAQADYLAYFKITQRNARAVYC